MAKANQKRQKADEVRRRAGECLNDFQGQVVAVEAYCRGSLGLPLQEQHGVLLGAMCHTLWRATQEPEGFRALLLATIETLNDILDSTPGYEVAGDGHTAKTGVDSDLLNTDPNRGTAEEGEVLNG